MLKTVVTIMQKKYLFQILSIICIVAGIVVTILGVMKYREETIVQQPVVEEYSWDDNGNKNVGEVNVSSDSAITENDVHSTNGDVVTNETPESVNQNESIVDKQVQDDESVNKKKR